MSAPANESDAAYGTRWGLFGAVLAPVLVAVGVLGALVAKGALALSFVAQSGTMDLATSGLSGTGFGVVVADVPTSGGYTAAARIGVGAAHINGLCLAEHMDVLGQPLTLLITGGDTDPASYEIAADGLLLDLNSVGGDTDPASYEIAADGLLLDLNSVAGVVQAGGALQINKSAADVAPGVALGGAADRFGLQAAGVQLRNVRATVRDIVIPHLLDMPSFHIAVVAGSRGCP
jgi:hypothetical protein